MKLPALSPSHLVTLSVLALAIPALAADAPATSPAPAPTTAAAPAPMPIFTPRDSRSSRYSRDSRSSRSSSSRDSYLPRSTGDDSDDILLRKSIFAKDRRPALVRDSSPRETTSASTRPPSIPVLIGVMREDTGFVAYIQDPDSGNIWPFAPGDPLPGDVGTVQDLTLDYMDIARSGPDNPSPFRIQIGQNLAGNSPDYSTPAAPAASATTAPATTAPAGTASTATPAAAPADTSGLSLEERMKLRAKQQRGQ